MSEDDIAVMKRSIEAQLDDYEMAIAAYAEWVAAWRAKKYGTGFRCLRKGDSEREAERDWPRQEGAG